MSAFTLPLLSASENKTTLNPLAADEDSMIFSTLAPDENKMTFSPLAADKNNMTLTPLAPDTTSAFLNNGFELNHSDRGLPFLGSGLQQTSTHHPFRLFNKKPVPTGILSQQTSTEENELLPFNILDYDLG